ncbi:thioredoxin [Azospirillum sp. TSH64]|uniref:thioredoxin n=1 Tax=Azospirillum sp. TSH64 TaxID=652740 RepID=UPI000D612F6C|nr:thioredoxin [Azospirillum sp. TSH64]PWC81269.1 hypothetical protein TSH64_01100 [Azospirillum sp. TSH64]
MSTVRKLDDADFDAVVLASPIPVVVDFYADWCGPCKAIAPVLDALSTALEGRLSIVKVNADNSPGIATRYGVRGLPTLAFFEGGQMVAMKTGAVSRGVVETWIAGGSGEAGARQGATVLDLASPWRRGRV